MSVPDVGQVLAGKYRVERILGQGGMGVVVQALHIQLEERVAMKFLLPEYAKHEEASARFLREARAAVKIKSEHVARVVDVGTLETDAPYMVMEYLEGQDLSQRLGASGRLPCEEAVDYVLQACEAIAEAHAAGIVHRDLKPANLFLTARADGSQIVKVLDFGISKVTVPSESGPDLSLTKTSSMMGSPLYMSPEQMRSARNVDARSDIWSLGAIAYELLAGTPPFEADSLPELCAKILSEPPAPVQSLRHEIPEGLAAAVHRCLEREPDQRFRSVAEFAVALVPFGPKHARVSAERTSKVISASGLSHGVPEVPASVPTDPAPPATLSAWGRTRTDSTKSRPVALIATAATVAVVGLVAIALVGLGRSEPQAPAAEAEPSAAGAELAAEPPAVTETAASSNHEQDAREGDSVEGAEMKAAAPSATPSVTAKRAAPHEAPAATKPAPKRSPARARPAQKRTKETEPSLTSEPSRSTLFGDRK